MVIYVYRWQLKEGMEQSFQEGWSYITHGLRQHCGSYGSRLHKGNDGLYYGYAQWPDRETRSSAAFHDENTDNARALMMKAVEVELPEIELDILSDYLTHPLIQDTH
ncbi:MAG: hypothetical protein EOP04_08360 [Proteobacteria bacterium]|nr:MAG: hypothetical protein EOP04_08360 [Pseudomonadota bacterium]